MNVHYIQMAFIHLGVDKIDVTMVECTCIPNKKMVPRPSHECQQYRFTIPLSLWYLKAMYISMIPCYTHYHSHARV